MLDEALNKCADNNNYTIYTSMCKAQRILMRSYDAVCSISGGSDSDIMLDDVTVSRHHAHFVATEDGWDIVDQGSLNGTYVNRKTVERWHLTSGDLVQIGKYRLQYLHAGEDYTAE